MTDLALPTSTVSVTHVIKGTVSKSPDVPYESRARRGASLRFTTPVLQLDELVWPRTEPGPAFETPIGEIVEFLVELGRHLDPDGNETVAQAARDLALTGTLSEQQLRQEFRHMGELYFSRDALLFELEENMGAAGHGWRPVTTPTGEVRHVRAFPPRLVHVLAGNGPGVAARSIARGALSRGVHLLKLPSNDLFTAPAILQTMARIDAGHPLTRSFSAVYWRGGDRATESVLYRAQFFDKIVAWGGEAGLRNVREYLAPGFELVAFDPKTSISIIGREAFDSAETLRQVAGLAAADVNLLNQEACSAARFQFVEGEWDDVARFSELLADQLRAGESGDPARPGTPLDIRQSVEMLRMLPGFQVWGAYDGRGLVVQSEEPVEWHPIARTVNVVPVGDRREAVRHASVATQTVGLYPETATTQMRDVLASSGAQRMVPLGHAGAGGTSTGGVPHDGFYPLHRLMRWVYTVG